MLVWKCAGCGTQMAAGEADAGKSFSCTSCGAGTFAPVTTQSPQVPPPVPGASPPSNNPFMAAPQAGAKVARCTRLVYILLGVFLGEFGIHNFVAGHMSRGFWQLGITLASCFLFFCTFGGTAFVILGVYIWAIVDIINVLDDADGLRMP